MSTYLAVKPVRLATALFLMIVVLSACGPHMGPTWYLDVVNPPYLTDSPVVFQECPGGLSAAVVAGTLVNLAASATPEEQSVRVLARHEGKIRVGERAILEATCTGADGSEIGYARVNGRISTPLHNIYGGQTKAYPPVAPGSAHLPECLPPTSARGAPPCIVERMVTPD